MLFGDCDCDCDCDSTKVFRGMIDWVSFFAKTSSVPFSMVDFSIVDEWLISSIDALSESRFSSEWVDTAELALGKSAGFTGLDKPMEDDACFFSVTGVAEGPNGAKNIARRRIIPNPSENNHQNPPFRLS